jgi:hypothetical protein
MVREQSLTEGQDSGTAAIGQEPERADADKAARQDVEQETAQKLLRTERHHSLLITVGIILPAKSNLIMLESHEAVVGDGHAMEKYIGMDVHQATVSAAVRDRNGNLLMEWNAYWRPRPTPFLSSSKACTELCHTKRLC